MLVGVLPQDISEEGAAGGEDDFVGWQLVIITSESYVEEVFVFTEFAKSDTNVRFEVVSAEAKLLCRTHL